MTLNKLLINGSVLTSNPTGISTYISNLLPSLCGIPSALLAPFPFEGYRVHLIPKHMSPSFGFRGHLRRLFWLQFNLPKTFSDLNASLLFSPLLEAPINYSNCRFIVTAHDVIPIRFPRNFSPLTNYFRYYVPAILKQAEHIICDSQSTARDLNKYYSTSASKLTVIPLAYDANNFRWRKPKTQLVKYFLYLGRQDPYKNLRRLVKAYHLISQKQDYELWLAGPEDKRYTPKLRLYINELGLESRVKILNYVSYEKLPELLGNAISLVFPTLWEGFGLPALEAMACGTPVITSKISSLPEVVGDAAVLIDPYNVEELADAMYMVANDSQFHKTLQIAGLKQAQQFSWEKTGQQTVDVLKQFL